MPVDEGASIGATLAAAREQAGMSVEDVSARTRLRATVIRAIERDDFAPSGGDFYARAQIREIARIVGADEAAIVVAFDAQRPSDDAPAVAELFDADRSAAVKADRRAKPNWTAVMAVVLLVVVGLGAYQVVKSSGHGSRVADKVGSTPTATQPASATGTSQTAPGVGGATTTPTPSATPGKAPSGVVADAPVTVVLDVTDSPCWAKAWGSDDNVLFQGLMQPGQTQTFTDASLVKLKLGNAPATNLTVNGIDIGAPPSKDQVTTVSFGPGDPTQAQG